MITPLYLSLLAIFYIYLSYRVVIQRRKNQVGLGFGKSDDIKKAVRIHGNFSEYIPIAIILLYFAELQNFPAWAMHISGFILLLGRILHCVGITGSQGASKCRVYGMGSTFFIIIILALFNTYKSLPHLL